MDSRLRGNDKKRGFRPYAFFCFFLLGACSSHHDQCIRKGCLGEQCMLQSQKAKPSERCEWIPADGCRQAYGKCGLQADGECGFQVSHALEKCLADPAGYGFNNR